MRVAAIVVSLLAAGCVAAPTDAPTIDANATAPTLPTANVTLVEPAIGERLPRAVEMFALTADRTLTTQGADATKVAVGNNPRGFFAGATGDFPVEAWTSEPFQRAFESAEGSELTLTFSSDTPAPGLGPSGLSPEGVNVFAWIGTPERYAVLVPFKDAPASLEAGKAYTLKAQVPKAKDLFVRVGEQLAIRPVMMYDGPGPFFWTVGDANLSSLRLDHEHFNVSAPVATTVLDEGGSYECQPNAAPMSFALDVPRESVYLVVDMLVTSTAPGHLDVDIAVASGGETIASGTGPNAKETVVLGPRQLARGGPFTASWACPVPSGTYALTVTAYGPVAP